MWNQILVEKVYLEAFWISRINSHPDSSQTMVMLNSDNICGFHETSKVVTFGQVYLNKKFNKNEPNPQTASNVVIERGQIKMECRVAFNKCGNVIYRFFNNNLMNDRSANYEITDTSTRYLRRKILVLKNVTEFDGGLYKCL